MSSPDLLAIAEADLMAAAVYRAERRVRVLQEVSEINLTVMRSLQQRVLAADAAAFDLPEMSGSISESAKAVRPAPPLNAEAALAKLSRSVRLTIDLEAKADEALLRLRRGEAAAIPAPQPAPEIAPDVSEHVREDRARARVAAQVAIAIGRESDSEAQECERLAAMIERMDHDVAYGDVESRPLREIVNQLCGELDLNPDWSGWTEDGWPARPRGGPDARPRWSPFHLNSRGPILERNQKYPRDDVGAIYDP